MCRAVPYSGDMVDDLVIGGIGESEELHFRHGPQSGNSHAKRSAHDAGLGDRGIKNTISAMLFSKTVRNAEHAAGPTYVLTQEDNSVIGPQGYIKGTVESLGKGYGSHDEASSN